MRTTVLVEEMLPHLLAVGHMPDGRGRPRVTHRPIMERSAEPAGSRTVSTAGEVLTFVRMHLDGGRAPDGSRLLSERSVLLMQRRQAAFPRGAAAGRSMGLGWILQRWSGRRVIGHGGGTIGQHSFMQALPDLGFAACLLTNAGPGALVWRDLGRWLFEDFAGVRIADMPTPPGTPPKIDLSRYAGVYHRLGMRCTVSVDSTDLIAELTPEGPLETMGAPPQQLRRVADEPAAPRRTPSGRRRIPS